MRNGKTSLETSYKNCVKKGDEYYKVKSKVESMDCKGVTF